jgi:hypothetical protein
MECTGQPSDKGGMQGGYMSTGARLGAGRSHRPWSGGSIRFFNARGGVSIVHLVAVQLPLVACSHINACGCGSLPDRV